MSPQVPRRNVLYFAGTSRKTNKQTETRTTKVPQVWSMMMMVMSLITFCICEGCLMMIPLSEFSHKEQPPRCEIRMDKLRF